MSTITKKDIYYPEMSFFLNESLSDVVFVVNGHRVPAIKAVLSLKSPVFAAMFSGNFSESKTTEIEIKDTTVDAFKTLIRFIYTEVILIKDPEDWFLICNVYQLSDRYEVLRLRLRVGQYLETKISLKNLIPISSAVFAFKIEEFMAKIVTFIQKNINELIRQNVKYLKVLNESMNDKLLDVLLVTHWADRLLLDYNCELISCYIGDKCIVIKKEVFLTKNVIENVLDQFIYDSYRLPNSNDKSFDAMKTFVGYLYFDKLILEDEDDLQLIRELCRIAEIHIKYKLFNELIENHLKKRITIEKLELISEIAFFYKLDGLLKCVNDFIKENFTEIVGQHKDILGRINVFTNNSLIEVLAEFIQRTVRL